MCSRRLDADAAAIERDALADENHRLARVGLVLQDDELRRLVAARVTPMNAPMPSSAICSKLKTSHFRSVLRGHVARGVGQDVRRHVVRRLVDQVAREIGRLRQDAAHARAFLNGGQSGRVGLDQRHRFNRAMFGRRALVDAKFVQAQRRMPSTVACAAACGSSPPPPAPRAIVAIDLAPKSRAFLAAVPAACRTLSSVNSCALPSPTTMTRCAAHWRRAARIEHGSLFNLPFKSPPSQQAL